MVQQPQFYAVGVAFRCFRRTRLPTYRTPDIFVRAARAASLPGQSETWLTVTCPKEGTHFLEGFGTLFDTRRLVMSNGIVDIKANVPFRVKVANFASTPQKVCKHQRIGLARPTPSDTPVYSLNFETPETPKVVAPQEKGAAPLLRDVEGEGLAAAFGLESHPDGVVDRITIDDVDLKHLRSKERDKVRQALRPFSSMWDGKLGTITVTKHRIELKEGAKPVFSQPYRAGPKAREVEQQEVDKMLREKVIEPAKSEYASPVVLVPKPDGSLRFCVDYRKLNSITVKDTYPLPRMDECLDSLGDAQYFTTLDCNSGYWQIPVEEADKPKTAFTCHAGCFQFCRMPFGLCNAPATFQRTIDILLSGFRWRSCLVYLDDIIVFSSTFDDHLGHVTEILKVLETAGISLKLSKCSFFQKSVSYLGEVATKNTAAIEGFKEPKTQTQMRSFIGLCNVYRRFVPNFARVAAPLNRMLQKSFDFNLPEFNEEEREAFNLLKAALANPPILQLPRRLRLSSRLCSYARGRGDGGTTPHRLLEPRSHPS